MSRVIPKAWHAKPAEYLAKVHAMFVFIADHSGTLSPEFAERVAASANVAAFAAMAEPPAKSRIGIARGSGMTSMISDEHIAATTLREIYNAGRYGHVNDLEYTIRFNRAGAIKFPVETWARVRVAVKRYMKRGDNATNDYAVTLAASSLTECLGGSVKVRHSRFVREYIDGKRPHVLMIRGRKPGALAPVSAQAATAPK